MSRGPTRRGLRHHPPAYAPIPAAALARATYASMVRPADAAPRLEALLCERFRADRAILFGSGTQALSAAIAAALAANDRTIVALPAYNCYDVATAAIGAGARVVLYDVDPDTLSPDPDSFDAALAAGAGAAVVASLYGYPIDWPRIEAAAAAHGTLVIEDAAQGMGATWHGSPLGSLGRMSVLSFGRGKGWTGGGGGALLLRGDASSPAPGHVPGRTAGLRTAVLAAAQWLLSDPRVYGIPASIPALHLGETHYREPARLQAPTSFSAALVLATADAARAEADARVATGRDLETLFAHAAQARTITVAEGGTAGYLRFPLRVQNPSLRSDVLRDFARAGVAHSYPGRVTDVAQLHPFLAAPLPACPGASVLVRELITLPTHSRSDRGALEAVRTRLV